MTTVKNDKEAELKARFKALKEKHDQESENEEQVPFDDSSETTQGVVPERDLKRNLGCG